MVGTQQGPYAINKNKQQPSPQSTSGIEELYSWFVNFKLNNYLQNGFQTRIMGTYKTLYEKIITHILAPPCEK